MTVEQLKQQLVEANNAYHNGEPIMTDDEFDALVAKWEHLTGRKWSDEEGVGAVPVSESGVIVDLPMWMGSMNKVKEEKDIVSWFHTWNPSSVIISDKLDGISCLFHWIPSRKTIQVFTRGNGRMGTDITGLLDIIPSLTALKTMAKSHEQNPKWLHKDTLEYFIRGELVIPKACWESERTTTWGDYANPRNTVAGLVNRKFASHTVSSKEALSKINFVPFSIDFKSIKTGKWMTITKQKMFQYLTALCRLSKHIPCVYHSVMESNDVTKQSLSQILVDRRKNSPYEIDGIIVWDNGESYEPNAVGNPVRAFAFKMVMEDQKAETLVTSVEWNVSRTGVWKPVVIFEPVTIGGSRISRATGNNAAWLLDRGVGVGARIVLVRSGDVIPKILDVVNKVPPTSLPMPPEGSWKWDANKTDIVATKQNILEVATQANYLVATLSIKSLSKRTLEKYVQTHENIVRCLPFPQIFPLVATKDKWLKVDGVKEKSADKFIERTQQAWSNASTEIRLVSLGLLPRGIGIKQVTSLSKHNILSHIISESSNVALPELRQQIEGLDGWGATRVGSLMESLDRIRKGFQWAMNNGPRIVVRTSGASIAPPIPTPVTGQLKTLIESIGDKEFVLFTGFRNKEWQTLLESRGKMLIAGLSGKHTSDNTIVVTKGSKDSSKVKKAIEKGIAVIRIE